MDMYSLELRRELLEAIPLSEGRTLATSNFDRFVLPVIALIEPCTSRDLLISSTRVKRALCRRTWRLTIATFACSLYLEARAPDHVGELFMACDKLIRSFVENEKGT